MDGPVSVDNDVEAVVIPEVPGVLSEEEIEILKRHFVQPDVLKEKIMLQNFIVAKSFVHNAAIAI